MSVLSRVSALTLLANPPRTAPRDLLPAVEPVEDEPQRAVSVIERLGLTGLGTSAARIFWQHAAADETVPATGDDADQAGEDGLFCPPPVRDDVALGEEVNDRVVDWAEQVRIYPADLVAGTPITEEGQTMRRADAATVKEILSKIPSITLATREARAKEILSKIPVITIATVDRAGHAWNTPVRAAYDEDFNFYWNSAIDSVHSQNIRDNPSVFLVIYDSTHQGSGEGVYVKGEAYELVNEYETDAALRCCYGRVNEVPPSPYAFLGSQSRRMYKAVPEQIWMNQVEVIDGVPVGVRVELDLL